MTLPRADSLSSTLWILTASGRQFLMCCSSWSVVLLGTKRPWRLPDYRRKNRKVVRNADVSVWRKSEISQTTYLKHLAFVFSVWPVVLMRRRVWTHFGTTENWKNFSKTRTDNQRMKERCCCKGSKCYKDFQEPAEREVCVCVPQHYSPTHILPMMRQPAMDAWTTGMVSDNSPSNTLQSHKQQQPVTYFSSAWKPATNKLDWASCQYTNESFT